MARESIFKGVHNASKSKALIVLYHRKHKLGLAAGLNLQELHLQSGVNYDYLRARLTFWHRWGYVSRRPVAAKGRPVYEYTIAQKGVRFIESVIPRDKLVQFIAEIKATRSTEHNQ